MRSVAIAWWTENSRCLRWSTPTSSPPHSSNSLNCKFCQHGSEILLPHIWLFTKLYDSELRLNSPNGWLLSAQFRFTGKQLLPLWRPGTESGDLPMTLTNKRQETRSRVDFVSPRQIRQGSLSTTPRNSPGFWVHSLWPSRVDYSGGLYPSRWSIFNYPFTVPAILVPQLLCALGIIWRPILQEEFSVILSFSISAYIW